VKNRLKSLWKSGSNAAVTQADRALRHTCAGRVINALTFIMIIFFLGLWITGFLLMKEYSFTQILSLNRLTDLNCLIFFGGLVTTIFFATLVGNFLRRIFWAKLVKRIK